MSRGTAPLRRLLLHADRGPLRGAWLLATETFMRTLAGYLRRGLRAAVYARGGFGFAEPVVGLSDIDLVAIVCDGEDQHDSTDSRLHLRWQRLTRTLPGLRRLVDLECYPESELEELRWTRFTYGLDGERPQSLFFPGSPRSWREPERRAMPVSLPDLWPVECWRRLSGPDLRPPTRSPPTHPHLLAWVHLQHWCRLGLRALADPAALWATYACVKLVAEPAKILLWLDRGERRLSRRDILHRAREVLPEEQEAIEFALALLGNLSESRTAPLHRVWPSFVRLAARIADRLSVDLKPQGTTPVRLEGGAPVGTAGDQMQAWPLGDWTALVWSPGREESFAVASGSAAELSAVVAAAHASTATRFVTLRHQGLMLRPGRLGREWFRSLDFGATDPVSAALLAARSVAAFPNVSGWSAQHTAARAVAEHAAWLQLPRDRRGDSDNALASHLAGLFSAARAGLLLRSLQDGDPVLTVTFQATAAALADRMPVHRSAIEDAYAGYRSAADDGRAPERAVLQAAIGALEELGCYPKPFPHLLPRPRSRMAGTG